MPKYKLVSPLWDGRKLHPAGKVMTFDEGEAPKSAKPYTAPVIESDEDEKPSKPATVKK